MKTIIFLGILMTVAGSAPALPREEVASTKGFGMGPPATAADVARALAADHTELPAGPVAANWDSVRAAYVTPEWFRDAKFGLFLHWGLYAVPGHASEWYEKHMYGNPAVAKWHAEHFGPQDKFGYKDFIPLFTCAKFDPEAWAELFRRSGAKYVVPTAEHHDGWALWDSALTKWDANDTGPRRDLIGELAAAVRRQGLRFGVSNHRIENYTFIEPLQGLPHDLEDPAAAGFYYPPSRRNPAALEAFLADWMKRNYELIDRYRPDLIFFDNGINHRIYDPLKLRVAAYYFNRAVQWGREVTFATKSDAFLAGSVRDYERQSRAPTEMQVQPFQVDDSVHHRWGYLNDAQYWDANTIICRLVENVSRNGNLLLNFAPRADGTIPDEQVQLLLGIGAWLDVNGEAIYGTRPWRRFGEGPTAVNTSGNLEERARQPGDLRPDRYSVRDFRFTRKGDVLYAIALAWPEDGRLVVTSLAGAVVDKVELLGHGPVPHRCDGAGLHLELPAARPCEQAYAFKITGLKMP